MFSICSCVLFDVSDRLQWNTTDPTHQSVNKFEYIMVAVAPKQSTFKLCILSQVWGEHCEWKRKNYVRSCVAHWRLEARLAAKYMERRESQPESC